jgi:hypothetical protein
LIKWSLYDVCGFVLSVIIFLLSFKFHFLILICKNRILWLFSFVYLVRSWSLIPPFDSAGSTISRGAWNRAIFTPCSISIQTYIPNTYVGTSTKRARQ